MKVVSYTALHYGSDYLYYAIKSVIDHVDEHWVIYSDVGSHGSRTDMRCPDTRDDLMAIAQRAAGDKLGWVDGRWGRETDQRGMIHELAPDADVIVAVDADEIWPNVPAYPGSLRSIFESAATQDRHFTFCWPIVHFWRSFYRAIIHDPAFPVRVIVPQNAHGQRNAIFPSYVKEDGNIQRPIAHMGYAQRPEIVRYKLETHGHRAEFRKDVDWFTDIFMANRQTDCHPVGSEWWNPEAVNPWNYLPDFMRQHPFANMEVIE